MSNNETSRDSDVSKLLSVCRGGTSCGMPHICCCTPFWLQVLAAWLLMAAAGILHIPIDVQTWKQSCFANMLMKNNNAYNNKNNNDNIDNYNVWKNAQTVRVVAVYVGILMLFIAFRCHKLVWELGVDRVYWYSWDMWWRGKVAVACYANMSGTDKLQQQ